MHKMALIALVGLESHQSAIPLHRQKELSKPTHKGKKVAQWKTERNK